jgi:hypothetical protein
LAKAGVMTEIMRSDNVVLSLLEYLSFMKCHDRKTPFWPDGHIAYKFSAEIIPQRKLLKFKHI